jgi:hypothetical protein
VDFDMGGAGDAGGETEVGAEAEATCARAGVVEAGPGADARRRAISTYDPAGGDRLAIEKRRAFFVENDAGIEGEAHAEGGGAVAEQLAENCAAQSEAREGRELGGYVGLGVGEGDACKREAVRVGKDAEGSKSASRAGHEPFAARLVDGRMARVGN